LFINNWDWAGDMADKRSSVYNESCYWYIRHRLFSVGVPNIALVEYKIQVTAQASSRIVFMIFRTSTRLKIYEFSRVEQSELGICEALDTETVEPQCIVAPVEPLYKTAQLT
jgi:hypothetical protein